MAATLIRRWFGSPFGGVAVAFLLSASALSAQSLSGEDLVHALQNGGYVLVIRNAQSPDTIPEERARAPGNLKGEREIDQVGQGQASVIAYALRQLDIPVGQTLHSPEFRSRQSANYLGRGKQTRVDSLAETGDAGVLLQRAAEAPPKGVNTVIVTHAALIEKAFGRDARGIANAETLVFLPADGGVELVARLKVEDWAELAVN